MPSSVHIDHKLELKRDALFGFHMRNNSGGTVGAGSPVILDTSVGAGDAFTTTTSRDDPKSIGMLTDTVANQGYGFVAWFGRTNLLKVDGTTNIAAGDFISPFTTAAVGAKATTGKAGKFAIALEAYTTDDGAGVIDAFLVPSTLNDNSSLDTSLADDTALVFGTGSDVNMEWDTADSDNHTLVLGLGDSNQGLHITDKAAVSTDWNIAATSHPNVYVHSNTTPATDYLRLGDHDGTTAYIDVVGGTTLAFEIAGTTEMSMTASNFDISGLSLLNDDNDKLKLGTGADATLYYDATNLVIDPKEAGSGHMLLKGTMVIEDNEGQIIGNSTQRAVDGYTPEWQEHGTAAIDSSMLLARWSADTVEPVFHFAKSRGAIGTFTIVTSGDLLGGIEAWGSDGVDFNSNSNASTAIRFYSSGTIAADRVPGQIRFYTASNAAPSVLTLAARIDESQQLHLTTDSATHLYLGAGDDVTFGFDGTSLVTTFQATTDEWAINESQANTDFRVESNNQSHTFFVDAAEDRVAIGASTSHASTAGTFLLSLFEGTAPAGSLANGASIFADVVSSDEVLRGIDSAGNVTTL